MVRPRQATSVSCPGTTGLGAFSHDEDRKSGCRPCRSRPWRHARAGPGPAALPTQIEAPVEAEAPVAKPGVQFTVGLGFAYLPDYEGSNDYKPVPLWDLRAGNLYGPETYVSLVGTMLRSNLIPDEHFHLGVTARYVKDYDNVDDNKVQDVKSTENAMMVGGTLGYDFLAGLRQDAALEVDALYDALHGNGYTLTPRFRFRTPVAERLLFEATASGSLGEQRLHVELLQRDLRRCVTLGSRHLRRP